MDPDVATSCTRHAAIVPFFCTAPSRRYIVSRTLAPVRSAERQRRSRLLVVKAARAALSFDGRLTAPTIEDVCEQAGIHPHAYRALFPTTDVLLDEIAQLLVAESASRMERMIEQFIPGGDHPDDLVRAAICLARSSPLDRAGLMIRVERRIAAVRRRDGGDTVEGSEDALIAVLVDILRALLGKLGRRLSWPPHVLARVVLDTYERSFEGWLLGLNEKSTFPESDYVREVLPLILRDATTASPTPETGRRIRGTLR
jgi:hypothetical protein